MCVFLLLVILVVACVLGWISWKIQTAKAELRLARELETAGHELQWSHSNGIEEDWPQPGWNSNWLRNHLFSHISSVTFLDGDIELLVPLKQLTELNLRGPLLVDIEALRQFQI